jgi:hypothetical protein
MIKPTIQKPESEIFGGAKMVRPSRFTPDSYLANRDCADPVLDNDMVQDVIHIADIIHNRGTIRAFPTKRFRT